MEPNTGGWEDDVPFQLGDFSGSMLIPSKSLKFFHHIPCNLAMGQL